LPTESKKCTMCGIEKSIDNFTPNKRRRDGHISICKECACIVSRANYQKFKEKIKKRVHDYHHTHKEHYREYSRQYRKTHKRNQSRYLKKYQQTHKQKVIEWQRKYHSSPKGRCKINHANHKRRARERNTEITLTVEQWENVLRIQSNHCNVCGKRFTKKRPPTIDHIIPLSKGGGLTYENIQALCKSCNSRKHAKIDPQFIQSWCCSEA